MGLFDNIIGNGAEEVEPLGIETISETSGSTGNSSATGDNGSNPGAIGTGGGQSDDTTNPIIIANNVGNISSDEIPEIDIGGDMDFSLFGGNTNESSLQSSTITTINNLDNISQSNNIITESMLGGSGMDNNISQVNNDNNIIINSATSTSTLTQVDISAQAGNTPISIGESPVTITNPIISETESSPIILSTPNDGLMGLFGNTGSAGGTDKINTDTATNPILDSSITINSSTDTGIPSIIDSDNSDILTSATTNDKGLPSIVDTVSSTSVEIDNNSMSPQIGNLGEITHSSIGHESLAEKINGFLKELQELKENDDALLKEKTAEIARLEAEKRELEMIQADRERLNKTIDLLSNIKNI